MFALRKGTIIIGFLLCLTLPAAAEVSVSIGLPHVSIGINLPGYPVLAPVPGYPVYYAPGIEANYFFYDGYYWVYQNDYWYASDWYNGPWWAVEPDFVPLFILRIPVVYYRHPPSYFYGWHAYEPPRWGQHWGHEWERRHGDWKHWQRDRTPAPAPRPDYQRGYNGQRYPKGEQQQNLRRQHYRYQPRDTQVSRICAATRGTKRSARTKGRTGHAQSWFAAKSAAGTVPAGRLVGSAVTAVPPTITGAAPPVRSGGATTWSPGP